MFCYELAQNLVASLGLSCSEIPGVSSIAGLFSRPPPSQKQIRSGFASIFLGGSPKKIGFSAGRNGIFHCGIRPPSGTLRSVRSCMLSCYYDDFTYDIMRFELSPKRLPPVLDD